MWSLRPKQWHFLTGTFPFLLKASLLSHPTLSRWVLVCYYWLLSHSEWVGGYAHQWPGWWLPSPGHSHTQSCYISPAYINQGIHVSTQIWHTFTLWWIYLFASNIKPGDCLLFTQIYNDLQATNFIFHWSCKLFHMVLYHTYLYGMI